MILIVVKRNLKSSYKGVIILRSRGNEIVLAVGMKHRSGQK